MQALHKYTLHKYATKTALIWLFMQTVIKGVKVHFLGLLDNFINSINNSNVIFKNIVTYVTWLNQLSTI